MSKKFFFFILFLTSPYLESRHSNVNHNTESKKEIIDKVRENNRKFSASSNSLVTRQCLEENQIQSIDTEPPGLIISEPGEYCLLDDVITDPRAQIFEGIITIATSNVNLNLNNKTINGSNRARFGVVVLAGLKNILIENGALTSMRDAGIAANSNIQGLVLDNIITAFCRNGYRLTGASEAILANCSASFNQNNGFQIGTSTTAISINFFLSECFAIGNNGNGFQFLNCSNFAIENCDANLNGFAGFLELGGLRFNFQNCDANTNRQNGFFVSGNDHRFILCDSDANFVNGTEISGNHNSLLECESKSNRANGFSISGIQHFIFRSAAFGNVAAGFLLTLASNQVSCRENTAIGNSIGFNNNSAGNFIYSNFANDNTTANFTGIPNVAVSPGILNAINFTANISN